MTTRKMNEKAALDGNPKEEGEEEVEEEEKNEDCVLVLFAAQPEDGEFGREGGKNESVLQSVGTDQRIGEDAPITR